MHVATSTRFMAAQSFDVPTNKDPRFAKKLISLLVDSSNFMKLAFGFVGQVAITPFELAGKLVVYRQVRSFRKQLEKTINLLYSSVSRNTEKENVDAHLAMFRLKRDILSEDENLNRLLILLHKTSIFNILSNRIRNEFYRIREIVIDAESTFKTAAYPNLNEPMTDERIDQLREDYRKSGADLSDWEDDSLDIYQKVYL